MWKLFEEGCTVDVLKEFNFQNNALLESIVLPSGLQTIWGTVLGGCPNLKKVTFTSENTPSLQSFTWSTKTYNVFEATTGGTTDPEKCIIEVPLKFASEYISSAAGTFLKDKKFPLSSPITMTSSGLMSCCSPLDFTVKQYNTTGKTWVDSDLKAYYVKSQDVKATSVTLTDIDQNTKITAEVGVILKGTAATAYGLFFPYTNAQPSSLSDLGNIDNSLVGVIEDKNWDEDGYDPDFYYFILNGGKFRPVTPSGILKANKAYLMIGNNPGFDLGGGTQNALSLEFSEGTGIGSTQMEKVHDDAIYTLQGVQVKQPTKGIFIKNGKKFVIK